MQRLHGQMSPFHVAMVTTHRIKVFHSENKKEIIIKSHNINNINKQHFLTTQMSKGNNGMVLYRFNVQRAMVIFKLGCYISCCCKK